ncbi:MAG TPA: group II intron reverse transcriptase/maturase [Opitutaceae bacterium]|nr:group II intron reverse transcriptase/maturase [Opitutaceae bacterium]
MLETLERGPKNGVWHSLIDKVYAVRTLTAAWESVQANDGAGGVDRETIAVFGRNAEQRIEELSRQLREGRYVPQPVRRVMIPKPGTTQERPLGIPTVRDRVVQTALRMVLEPIFERDFARESFGFRPGRSCHQALARVETLLAEGYTHVVDADLKSYFDTIPHAALLARVKAKVVDGRILELVEGFLQQGVLEEGKGWSATTVGTPQGGVISPLLANIYLDALDWKLHLGGWELVRYADDFVILCRTREQAEAVLGEVRHWCDEAGLQLHPEKTRLVDMSARGGFDFLGYHFERTGRWPREKSLAGLEHKLHRLTRRTCGENLSCLIEATLNPILRGWMNYFRRSTNAADFRMLDSYLRARLRAILRKRHGLRGRSRGRDHQRWPNRYFGELGLLSLEQLWASFISSPLMGTLQLESRMR